MSESFFLPSSVNQRASPNVTEQPEDHQQQEKVAALRVVVGAATWRAGTVKAVLFLGREMNPNKNSSGLLHEDEGDGGCAWWATVEGGEDGELDLRWSW
jgi:hypothetical protein